MGFKQNKTTQNEMPIALCISEDKAFLNEVRTSLGYSEFVTIVTNNPNEALELAKNEHLDVIVCDYDLSQMDGLTLFESIIHSQSIYETPPTLIVSEQYAAPLLVKVLNAGAAGLHAKTDPIDALLEKVISILKDSEKRFIIEKKSSKRAVKGNVDLLTNIASKEHFARRFSAESVASYRDSNSISVLMLAIDQFKKIEDRHGKHKSENVLSQTARIIEGELRSRDCVGRYAEHSFSIILPEATLDTGKAVADRLKRILSSCDFGNLDNPIPITVSIGVSTRPANIRSSPDEMLIQSMKNCAAAQGLGGNKVMIDKNITGKPVAVLLANPGKNALAFAQNLEAEHVEVRIVATAQEAKKTVENIPTTIIAVMHPLLKQHDDLDFLIWARNKRPASNRILIAKTIDPNLFSKAVNEAEINNFFSIPWKTGDISKVIHDLLYE